MPEIQGYQVIFGLALCAIGIGSGYLSDFFSKRNVQKAQKQILRESEERSQTPIQIQETLNILAQARLKSSLPPTNYGYSPDLIADEGRNILHRSFKRHELGNDL